MNSKPDRDRLWDDMLTDSTPAELREDLLRNTVGIARRRRQRRTVLCLAAAVIPLVAILTLRNPGDTMVRQPRSSTPAAVATETKRIGKPEIISDEELFAIFPNHALALVGPPGNQRLVILGERSQEQ